ncbi:aspartyl-phosphate phosphatase Spo0E family protein [Bacillus sp. FJAT-29937]|uniref:aspartyl-phosphate phosphatase Spo0E family protein n=1 Tax=Bacillus sp. FJAT-29937 TaxID=1720553 RepID=UPI0009EC8BD1|nr:aspartyl-phosphate phosphatase Spo0E family protein [Bacillus sp. FJAT-29937]
MNSTDYSLISKDTLLKTIEFYRAQLIEIGVTEGINSNQTIEISQQLDKLIFLYQKTS